MVGALQPDSCVCVAAIQNGIFDLASANMHLVKKSFKEKSTLLIDHHVSTQDAIEGSINSEMQDTIRQCKREFKKQFKAEHPNFASSEPLKAQYKLEKIRYVLQVEHTLLCEDLKRRFNYNTAVSFLLKVDSKNFTQRRWLEIFFEGERTPTDERDTLKKFLLKERDDFSLTHVYYSAGEMGARSVIGRFAKEIFNFAEDELKKLNLDAERKTGTITEALLQARNPDRNIVEVFLRSLLIDHYTNMQMFIDGGMLTQIAKQLPPKSYSVSPAPTTDEEVATIFKATLNKGSIIARAKADKVCKLPIIAEARAMINSFAPLLVADVNRIINTIKNILAVSKYLNSLTQSMTGSAAIGRDRAQSMLRSSSSRIEGRNSATGLPPTLATIPPLLTNDVVKKFEESLTYFETFLKHITPQQTQPTEKSLLSSIFSNLGIKNSS